MQNIRPLGCCCGATESDNVRMGIKRGLLNAFQRLVQGKHKCLCHVITAASSSISTPGTTALHCGS